MPECTENRSVRPKTHGLIGFRSSGGAHAAACWFFGAEGVVTVSIDHIGIYGASYAGNG